MSARANRTRATEAATEARKPLSGRVAVVAGATRGAGRGIARALGAPARDLHSGDAQEYLLFLVGVAVLALLLPVLR